MSHDYYDFMGKVGLYVKISFLAVGLVIVILVIRSLTTDKVEGALQALGAETGSKADSPMKVEGSKRTLCRTRVLAVRFPDGKSVVERKSGLKLDWVGEEVAETSGNEYGPGPGEEPPGRSLAYLEIEKWFVNHCEFLAEPAPAVDEAAEPLEPSNEPKKYVRFDFIDGSQLEFYKAGRAIFSASHPEDRFESAQLEEALDELRALAAFPVDSKVR